VCADKHSLIHDQRIGAGHSILTVSANLKDRVTGSMDTSRLPVDRHSCRAAELSEHIALDDLRVFGASPFASWVPKKERLLHVVVVLQHLDYSTSNPSACTKRQEACGKPD
jgi:hypothetical protein